MDVFDRKENVMPALGQVLRSRLTLPATLAVGLLVMGACSVTTSRAPAGRSTSVTANTPPAPDTSQVATTLGPSVAEVVIPSGRNPGLGSGFVIAHDQRSSYLVTNNHVVSGATKVQVLMPDGQVFTADIKGTDPVEDVAVLQVSNPDLPLSTFADSSKLRVGQQVVAIGNPLGNQGSVTSGIISALHRTISANDQTSSENLPDVLQTDAAINPGNSGGPLADAAGQVVGMNVAGIEGGSGIGFAIPSRIVARIANDLIAGHKPGHPYLGIQVHTEDDLVQSGQPVKGFGDLVVSVIGGCPAAQAGIRSGDVIQSVAGTELRNGQTLGGIVQVHNPGESVPVAVLRDSSQTTLNVTLADQPASGTACS
jgi:putative serine protease PepD